MKTSLITGTLLLSSGLVFGKCSPGPHHAAARDAAMPQAQENVSSADNTRIQVALLLDTSNSMDGLIDQAKSRLWNIINTLTTLKYRGRSPRIEIALYEYGNDGLSHESNYIRQVTPMTSDLDLVSEKLFALRTNGGDEYCGAVIGTAVKKLDWGHNAADMKLIYIAGNEPFNQGSINYKETIADALGKDIYVNTIFCGSREDGISTFWKDGAERGKGKFFNINSDEKVRFIETPYDRKLEACNQRLNDTYIGYGATGAYKKSNQLQQDKNAGSLSSANYAERAVSKSKAAYRNSDWDLVDRVKDDKQALEKLKSEELPAAYKGKSKTEISAMIAAKTKEREAIQKEIEMLARQRQAYIEAEMKKEKKQDDLGAAINTSILELAKDKGYALAE